MDDLPECAKIIEKLNIEYDELYTENQKTENQNNILLDIVSEILLKHIIESEDLEYEANQMYDIIESLTRHESYDIMYYFKRHNITDINTQKSILNKLVLKIKNLCEIREKCKFSTKIINAGALHSVVDNQYYKSLDENMRHTGSSSNTYFTVYISEYNLDQKNLKFTTRCLVANPYWEGIIEGCDDYNIYFDNNKLICPKTMTKLEKCNCQTCDYIKNKISRLEN